MMKKIEWVLCFVISFSALISSLSSKATHQKHNNLRVTELTSQNNCPTFFLILLRKGMPWWVWCLLVFSIKFEFSAMNLQPNGLLLQKCGTLTKGININVGRKTNMSRACTSTQKTGSSGTIIPKQKGFHTRFCPSEGRFLFRSYTKLALRCMFAVWDSFLADYPTNMDVSAGALLMYNCMRGVSM